MDGWMLSGNNDYTLFELSIKNELEQNALERSASWSWSWSIISTTTITPTMPKRTPTIIIISASASVHHFGVRWAVGGSVDGGWHQLSENICFDGLEVVLWWFIELYSWFKFVLPGDGRADEGVRGGARRPQKNIAWKIRHSRVKQTDRLCVGPKDSPLISSLSALLGQSQSISEAFSLLLVRDLFSGRILLTLQICFLL